jgi:hypothetical protein
MKKLIPVLFLFLFGCASFNPITEEQRHFEVVEQHSLTKDKAYDAIIEWIATYYADANSVILLKEKENGRIILQAVGIYYYNDVLNTVLVEYNFTLIIRIADNKIKFEFTTSNTINNSKLPQVGDLNKINDSYLLMVNDILTAMKNYKGNEF